MLASVKPAKPKLLPKPGSVKVFRALHSYTANTTEELSFEEGEFLYIYEQSKDGWWRARCKGKSGLVPFNYVEACEELRDPLHDAVRRGNISFLTECLRQGVSATGLDSMGNTALYWAAHSGHLDCLRALLDLSNPPVNAQNNLGDTPLHAAASKGHIEIIEELITRGANTTLKNNDAETPQDIAHNNAVKNILQLSHPSRNFRSAAYDPEDYEDDSDG